MGSGCLQIQVSSTHEPETSMKSTGLVGLEEVSFNLPCPSLDLPPSAIQPYSHHLPLELDLIHRTEMAASFQSSD